MGWIQFLMVEPEVAEDLRRLTPDEPMLGGERPELPGQRRQHDGDSNPDSNVERPHVYQRLDDSTFTWETDQSLHSSHDREAQSESYAPTVSEPDLSNIEVEEEPGSEISLLCERWKISPPTQRASRQVKQAMLASLPKEPEPEPVIIEPPIKALVTNAELHMELPMDRNLAVYPFEPEVRDIPENRDLIFCVYANGRVDTVIEKAFDNLTPEEERGIAADLLKAKRKEIGNWATLGTYFPESRANSRNVLDSRWVRKWRMVEGTGARIIKSRLTVKGFRDSEGPHLDTYAGTATRWAQRPLCSVAVQRGWKLISADVASAFLKGVTFERLAAATKEPIRAMSFEPPRGDAWLFGEPPGMSQYDPSWQVLRMLKPGFGPKDAPRLWAMMLDHLLRKAGCVPTRVDQKLYLLWDSTGKCLRALISTHVDDLKMAGNEDAAQHILN